MAVKTFRKILVTDTLFVLVLTAGSLGISAGITFGAELIRRLIGFAALPHETLMQIMLFGTAFLIITAGLVCGRRMLHVIRKIF